MGIHQNPRLPEAHGHLRLWPGRILRRGGHVFILWDRRSSHPWVQHGAASNLGRFANPNGLKSMDKNPQSHDSSNVPFFQQLFGYPHFHHFQTIPDNPKYGWAYHRPMPIPKLHPPQLPTGSRTRAGTTWQASLLSSSDWSWLVHIV